MCQVNTGAYFVRLAIFPDPPEDVKKKKKVSLLAPGKTAYTAYHPRKTTTYMLHVVPITTYTQVNWKKEAKKRKEENVKKKARENLNYHNRTKSDGKFFENLPKKKKHLRQKGMTHKSF